LFNRSAQAAGLREREVLSMPRLVNSKAIKRTLRRDDDLHDRLMRQCCYRALERDQRCLREVTSYPDPAVGNLTREEFEARRPLYEFVMAPEVAQILERIDLWLKHAVERKESWIEKADNSGRVTRLRNIKTLEDALALCEQDEERARRSWLVRKDLDEGNDPGEVEVARRFQDGWAAVKLKTPAALRWEARHMRNCLANPIYARRLTEYRVQYFSIRDADRRPHVTIEVRAGRVTQCKGRANSDPFISYGDKIEALARAMGWGCPDPHRLQGPELLDDFRIGQMLFERDVTLSTRMLPLARTLFVEGGFTAVDQERLTSLPVVMHVAGDLLIRRCRNLRHMPEWLRVDGDTVIEDCGAIRQLAANFHGLGSLSLRGCPQVKLNPARTIVGRALEVRRCPKAVVVPSSQRADVSAAPIRPSHASA
jgi:hypothetical protein